MRLLTKTTLYFLVAMVVLLAAGGFYLFSQFSRELDHQTDQELIIDEIQWIRYLRTQADNGTRFILRTPELLIFPVNEEVKQLPTITQTKGFSAKEEKEVPYRQLSHVVSIRGIPYHLTIRRSQEQKVVFVDNVTQSMLVVFAGMFVTILLFNWLINQTMWKPFARSLQKIRGAELQQMEGTHFEKTNIREFNELNASLNYMTGKIHNDYVNMKEFTENAAHEMQTPLAVVQSKIELLLQDTNLTDEQVGSILQAGSALKRLSNLNQALLLLARIENKQYETSESVNLTLVARKYLHLFAEIINDKKITVAAEFTNDFIVSMHPFLADSLISNLVGNAIKYNYFGGHLTITTTKTTFSLTNTSIEPGIEDQQLFKRFTRRKSSQDSSNGLGLAIVKKICDTHHLKITYAYQDGVHRFTLNK